MRIPGRRQSLKQFSLLAALALVAGACSSSTDRTQNSVRPETDQQSSVARVIETYAHDPSAFTQGWLVDGDSVFESTGQYGQSELRELDLKSGEVLRSVDLEPEYFGEGLAKIGDRLIQLTWREGKALVYDIESFEVVDEHDYEGEGWGLCYNGEALVMSDGSSEIQIRDVETFEIVETVEVQLPEGSPDDINELECTESGIWANIWQTDEIIQIDLETGQVKRVLDLSFLDPENTQPGVLNGVAEVESNVLLVTGKNWDEAYLLDI